MLFLSFFFMVVPVASNFYESFVSRRCGEKREKEVKGEDTCDVKASQVGTQMSSYQKKQGPACPHDPATCTLITEQTTTAQALKGKKKVSRSSGCWSMLQTI